MVQKCERTFNLHTNEFSSNVALKYFYENESYLSQEEKSLKNSLENDLKKVFELNKYSYYLLMIIISLNSSKF